MTSLNVWFGRSAIAAAAAGWLVSGSLSLAQHNDVWDRPPGGVWELGANWADGSAPGNSDTATFNIPGAYLVEFGTVPPAIRSLNLTGGNVTFASFDGTSIRTLKVNSTQFDGPRDVSITNGTTLSLGTAIGFAIRPLHVTGAEHVIVADGATLNVRFGSDVITSHVISAGQINVTGLGSALDAVTVGIERGGLNVTDGGIVQDTGSGIVGFESDDGGATVSGAGSQWISNVFVAGHFGQGTLDITAGGKVQCQQGILGNFAGGVGIATVSGSGSQLNANDLAVGNEGSGTLNVTGGGIVSSTRGFVASDPGSDGTATITGGAWTMTGRLSIAGGADPGGGGTLIGGTGTVTVQPAGTVSAAQGVVLFPNAHLNLQGGTLDASSISYHQGIQGSQFQWSSGTLHVGTFNGNLVNTGGVLAPGHSPGSTTVNGNYTQQNGGDMEIEISGSLGGSEFDFVNVTGAVTLDGDLDLKLTGGFLPTPAQTFAIVISNGLSGAFDNAASGQRVTTTDGGGSFLVNYGLGSPFDDNQVILSAFQPGSSFTADFDEDGDVDDDDLTQWRGDFGVDGGSDADSDGDSDGADFLAWQRQLGSPSVTPASAPIPEPATVALLILAAAGPCAPKACGRNKLRQLVNA